jgi:ubiquinone/menaquinone biosynthesis C-methylase UbiE
MKWNHNEIDRLSPILEQISADLAPVDGKSILILGSAAGEVALRLAEMMEVGKVSGVELDPDALELARRSAHEMGLEGLVEFLPVEKNKLPVEDGTYDALVSDLIIYPTSSPTDIEQVEMVRCLKPGGRMIITDVLVCVQFDERTREELAMVGLDYLRNVTLDEYKAWLQGAGLINVKVDNVTETLRPVWEARQEADHSTSHVRGYELLLDDPITRLGKGIFYIYAMGNKPPAPKPG